MDTGSLEHRIQKTFSYHPQRNDEQGKRYQRLRREAKKFATLIAQSCPDCDERKRSIDNLDQTLMLAIASIARNE